MTYRILNPDDNAASFPGLPLIMPALNPRNHHADHAHFPGYYSWQDLRYHLPLKADHAAALLHIRCSVLPSEELPGTAYVPRYHGFLLLSGSALLALPYRFLYPVPLKACGSSPASQGLTLCWYPEAESDSALAPLPVWCNKPTAPLPMTKRARWLSSMAGTPAVHKRIKLQIPCPTTD